jgi:hypothetical protein
MQVQSLLFSRADGWTAEKAKSWAKKHNFKASKVDVTDQYIRLRQLDPKGFQVKRTIPFGKGTKGIRAVVAREETMGTKKKKKTTTARRHATKRKSAAKPKTAHRRSSKRRAAPKAKKTAARVVSARRRSRRVRETGRVVAAKRRHPRKARRMRETTSHVVAAKRRKPRKARRVRETTPHVVAAKRRKPRRAHRARETGHVVATKRRRAKRGSTSYVMAKKRHPRRTAKRTTKHTTHRRTTKRRKVQAWHGDSAGHSKAAKKGWRTRKGGKAKSTKKVTESRRRGKRRMRETTVVQSRRRPSKRRMRESTTVHAKRRRSKRRVRETTVVRSRSRRRSIVRAPSLASVGRSALDMGFELGAAAAGYLIADGVSRFLATYDPAAANKPANKFTSDGVGTLANALNVASSPDLVRYGVLGAMTLLPLGGSLFVKHPTLRSSIEGIGLGAGIKLVSTLWSSLLMPLLVGKDTSVPALQKSWIARLYPAEVAAALNEKSGTAAVSSGGAASKAGTLSGDSSRDAGPFALGGRFDHGRGIRDWVTPTVWQPSVPTYSDPAVVDVPAPAPVPYQPAWPAHFNERHRWGLRGVGDAVQDMASTIASTTGVHPAHAVNAAMHVAAEQHDITEALRRALPHLRREILFECGRRVHPHLTRMHAHARYPREHEEWVAERAAEGVPAPEHDAPEHEWQAWHNKRAAASLPPAPHPPEPPPIAPPTPVHLRARHEWRPKSDREITYDRYMTTQQALGIGSGGPATGGNPGQPGLGDAFADAAQSAAASVPNMPLENAVNVAAYAATEPFNCERAIERAMPFIRRELATLCATNMGPSIRLIHEQGIPLPPADVPASPVPPVVVEQPPPPPTAVIEFVPSPPPPSWTRTEAEWHEQERHDWERMHSGAHPSVVAAATQAATAAAAPHADANKPAVAAAVHAAADGAAQAAAAAPPGTPTAVVQQAAKEGAKTAAAAHGAAADHPAVQAAVAAAAPAAAHAAAPATGTAGVGFPPKHLQVGPPKLPKPQGPQPLEKESCGCAIEDSPFLGFVGDEADLQQDDRLFTTH